MAEVTGTVTAIEVPDSSAGNRPLRVRVETDEGKERSLSVWKNIPQGDQWIENTAATVKVGDYGAFVGEYEDWTGKDGTPRKSFKTTAFSPRTKIESPNGSTPSGSPESRTSEGSGKDAAFALSYAKDIVRSLVETHGIKETGEIQGIWLTLADAGSQWLKQNN